MSAFNGAGTFVISGVGLPYVTGTTISSTVANQLNNDLATGLSTCLTKDGQTTPVANIPLGGFKLTGVGAPTAPGDALVFGQPATVGNLTVNGNATISGTVSAPGGITAPGIVGANKIINGEFKVSQRGGGSFAVPTAVYWADRWVAFATNAAKIGVQSFSGAVVFISGQPGFWGSIQSKGAYVPAAGEAFGISQAIEGLNCADMLFGAAAAMPVTVSFWARSDVIGQYGGSLRNGATNRSYTFAYTITLANTWQKFSITIPGDTAGTWAVDTSAGCYLFLCASSGASFLTAPGVWTPGNFFGATGQTNLLVSNTSELLFTGIKLEVGSVATPFVSDDYKVELGKCQRYYYRWNMSSISTSLVVLSAFASNNSWGKFKDLPVPMRTTPAASVSAIGDFRLSSPDSSANQPLTSLTFRNDPNVITITGAGISVGIGMSAGQAVVLTNNTAAAWLAADAEL